MPGRSWSRRRRGKGKVVVVVLTSLVAGFESREVEEQVHSYGAFELGIFPTYFWFVVADAFA